MVNSSFEGLFLISITIVAVYILYRSFKYSECNCGEKKQCAVSKKKGKK